MSGPRFSFPACVIAGKGKIDSCDLLLLRRYAYTDGVKTYEAALPLLALNDICTAHCREWPAYFVEQLTTFIVQRAAPAGRIDDLKAAWLVRVLGNDGIIENPLQLDLLLHVMDAAGEFPPMLTALALEQLRHAISQAPAGCYRAGRNDAGASDSSGMTELDIAFLWRVLKPAVNDGRIALSKMETALLYAIDRLVAERENHPGWYELMESVEEAATARRELRSRPWLIDLGFEDSEEDSGRDTTSSDEAYAMPQHVVSVS